MLSHVVITYMIYPEVSKMFEWRLKWYETMVLPRLLKQTDQNFDIAIRCNPAHEERIKALSNKIIIFHEKPDWLPKPGRMWEDERVYFHTNIKKFCEWENIIGLKQYDIQTCLDSDDLVSLDYIETIKKIVESHDMTKSMHIGFQWEVFDPYTFNCKKTEFRYDENNGSPYYSIYQPNKEKYLFLRDSSHLRMPKKFDLVLLYPEGKCFSVCNGHNYWSKYESL